MCRLLLGIVTAGAITVGCTSARPATPRYTLRQFLEVKRANTPMFSPDGSQIGFVTNVTGDWQVWVAPSTGGRPRQLTSLPSGIANVRWSPTAGEFAIAVDRGGDQLYQLALVRADGSSPQPLTNQTDVKHDLGGWSLDGRLVHYASNARDRKFFDCYVMDMRTRSARLVLQRDAVVQAAAMSPDNALLAAVEVSSEVDQNVLVAEVAIGHVRSLTPHTGSARFRVVGFSPDSSLLYVVTDLDRDFLNLAAIDVRTSALRYLETTPHDLDVAILSRDGTRFALSHNYDGYEQLSVVDAAGAAAALPEMPRGIVVPGDFSADGRKLAITITTPTHDDDVFLIDLAAGALVRITQSDQSGIDERALVSPSLVHFPARDGLQIPAFLYVPTRVRGRLPVIVSIHGGPETQEQPWFWASYQYLANRGYAVLAPNIRGSTGFGKQYLALDNGAKRWDALDDIAAAVDWLRARPDVDPVRIVGFGASYGGFMVLAMLAHRPGAFAAGVDFYGPSDLSTFLARTASYRREQRIAEYGDPERDAAFLAEISPAKHVDRIVAPLLVVQGAKDPIVPPAESADLVEQLRARGRTVRYLLIPEEGHGFAKQAHEIQAYEAMVAFLNSLWR